MRATAESATKKKSSVMTVRVSEDLHIAAKRKAADVRGGFQKLLSDYLKSWVYGSPKTAGAPLQCREDQIADVSRFLALLDGPENSAKRALLTILREM